MPDRYHTSVQLDEELSKKADAIVATQDEYDDRSELINEALREKVETHGEISI